MFVWLSVVLNRFVSDDSGISTACAQVIIEVRYYIKTFTICAFLSLRSLHDEGSLSQKAA